MGLVDCRRKRGGIESKENSAVLQSGDAAVSPLSPSPTTFPSLPLHPDSAGAASLTVEPAEEAGAKEGGKAAFLAGMGGIIVWSSLEEGEERASSPSLLA